jgi:hypothetical protein
MAAIVIVAVVAVIGGFLYFRTNHASGGTKPEDALKNDKIREGIGKKMREQLGGDQGTTVQAPPPANTAIGGGAHNSRRRGD